MIPLWFERVAGRGEYVICNGCPIHSFAPRHVRGEPMWLDGRGSGEGSRIVMASQLARLGFFLSIHFEQYPTCVSMAP